MPATESARSTTCTPSSPSSRSGADGSTASAGATASTASRARPAATPAADRPGDRRRATARRRVPAGQDLWRGRMRPMRARSASRSPAACGSPSTASSGRGADWSFDPTTGHRDLRAGRDAGGGAAITAGYDSTCRCASTPTGSTSTSPASPPATSRRSRWWRSGCERVARARAKLSRDVRDARSTRAIRPIPGRRMRRRTDLAAHLRGDDALPLLAADAARRRGARLHRPRPRARLRRRRLRAGDRASTRARRRAPPASPSAGWRCAGALASRPARRQPTSPPGSMTTPRSASSWSTGRRRTSGICCASATSARWCARTAPSAPRSAGWRPRSTRPRGRFFRHTCDADLGDAAAASTSTMPAFRGDGTVAAATRPAALHRDRPRRLRRRLVRARAARLDERRQCRARRRSAQPPQRAAASSRIELWQPAACRDRRRRRLPRHRRLRQALRDLPRRNSTTASTSAASRICPATTSR